MKRFPLAPNELDLVQSVFRKYPEALSVVLFGARAKGAHTKYSDVGFVISGSVTALGAEAIGAELDELPLPYRFDVQSLPAIKHRPLLEHIRRVGIPVYRFQAGHVQPATDR